MTPARPWFLVLAGLYAATAGACVWLWWSEPGPWLTVAAVCAPGALGCVLVWASGPAPAWVVRVDAWIGSLTVWGGR